ncbi:hypothetical protein [Rhodoferax antarcticus]|uniref:hypothetical protein n=1 Tax=Rhodoferax antarcticus TaxID=81479 RepID=UPI001115178F|nr:hypothetical protein [Rhodoferax antarcticus]
MKTAAMHFGEQRAVRRGRLMREAEAALKAGEYGQARRLAKLVLKNLSRNNPIGKSQQKGWKTLFLKRVSSAISTAKKVPPHV